MSKFLKEISIQINTALTLNQIIESGKIPHAFLFSGPEGIGKEFLALQFTKAISDKLSNESNSDHIISKIENFNEPYLKYVFPLPRGKNETDSVGPFEKLSEEEIELIKNELKQKSLNPFYRINIPKAKSIKINSIRDIHKFLSTSFQDLRYRVILISEAHLMNEEAQNALLKNLEEPPEGVIFILCTAYPERLRTTIHSRCWSVNIAPLTDAEVIFILTSYYNCDKVLTEKIVPFAAGSITKALELIDNDFIELRERTIRILRYSFARRFHSAFTEFKQIADDKDEVQLILIIRMIVTWLNDLYRYRNNYNKYFFTDHLQTLEKFNSRYPSLDLRDIANRIDSIGSSLKNNININTAIGNVISELSSIVPQ
ncbi:MAG: AAA family ATPase [Ignavibacteriaceae bacterium]